jgi:uncharacterized RDD family membrane protein YckC
MFRFDPSTKNGQIIVRTVASGLVGLGAMGTLWTLFPKWLLGLSSGERGAVVLGMSFLTVVGTQLVILKRQEKQAPIAGR